MDPIANRLYILRQQFNPLPISLFLCVFYANCALCNTQQSYSPPGRGNSSWTFCFLRTRFEPLADFNSPGDWERCSLSLGSSDSGYGG